jgi:uncharacterized protein involved in response to NO
MSLAVADPPVPSRSLVYASSEPAVQRRAWLAKGFRPFFLAAAAFAALALPIWVLMLHGYLESPTYFGGMFWHAHEMVFGFAAAVIAGFLLTAVSNWTNRPTPTGVPLALLVLLWLSARVALVAGDVVPRALTAALDLAFLPALALGIGRPIVAARNRRNYVFVAMLAALELCNLMTHLGALGIAPHWVRIGNIVAIDVITLMMVVVSGRVIPMFTRSATGVASIRSSTPLDRAAILATLSLTLLDALSAPSNVLWPVAIVAGLLVAARARHFGIQHTVRQPLLWVLHFGHAWIFIGLLLKGTSYLTPALGPSAALHALTAGAIGTLTLGMMTRVGLGHTGRHLAVPRSMAVAFGAVTLAALIRVVGPLLDNALHLPSILAAALLWTIAFVVYLAVNAPALVTPRIDGRPG